MNCLTSIVGKRAHLDSRGAAEEGTMTVSCTCFLYCSALQASERTLTAEELQEKEQQRLAALEAARLKRMRAEAGSAAAAAAGDEGGSEDAADDDDGGAAGAAGLPQGGYAAKRERMQREAEQWEKRQRRKMQASGARFCSAVYAVC
jgi:hypothetical protein